MTDFETVTAMLRRARIVYDQKDVEFNGEKRISITVVSDEIGYSDFQTEFHFSDKDGSLRAIGAWE